MVRLKPKQRVALGDMLRQLANIAAASFVVGQFVATRPVSWRLLLVGMAAWFLLAGVVLLLAGDES